jgi:hypothetical protein
MDEAPANVKFKGKKARRAPKIAFAAIVVALFGFGLGLIPPPEEPPVVVEEPPPPPPESDTAGDRVLEAGRDLAEAIRHGFTGQPPTPTPTPEPPPLPVVAEVSSLGMARVFSVILGLAAALLGAFSWFMGEQRWASVAAILLGIVTVAWNALILALVAAAFAVLAIVVSRKAGSKGAARSAG